MKEKFLEDQEKAINDALDAFHDDDYQLEEYYSSLGKTPTTQESTIRQIQGTVDITNRVNSEGTTTITTRQ